MKSRLIASYDFRKIAFGRRLSFKGAVSHLGILALLGGILASAIVTVASIASAPAAGALSDPASHWSLPSAIDGTTSISSVSCPSETFCMVLDSAGNYLIFNGTTWSAPAPVAGSAGRFASPGSLSCPTTSFCIAVDSHGDALEYSSGSWSSGSWSNPLTSATQGFQSVSCANASYCMAVDSSTTSAFNRGLW